jgi:hypothetical protein
MSDKVWTIRVTLTTGETRHLAGGNTAAEAVARITDLEQGVGAFAGDWCRTEDSTMVAKAHIVEASVVPLPDGPLVAFG